MRGFEQCSTSYTVGSKCAWQQARPQCPLRHTTIRPVRQRLHAVSAKDTSLAHSTPDGQMAIQQAPWGGQVIQSFLRPHVTFQEAVDGSWADKVDDWAAFWEGPYEIVDNDAELVDYELDDTYDALKRRNIRDSELTRQAKAAISKDVRSSTWREQHPDAVHWMGNPGWKAGEPEDPEPEPLPERDWTDLELRAWVEKRKWQAGKDAEWLQRQQDVGRFDVLNVTEDNDTRLMPRYELSKEWSHEDVWDLITNGGMNANPADVPMKVYDPSIRADYFNEGIKYFPETDEWLASIGHWWEDEAEPDLGQEVTMLASDFSDINIGSNADDADDQSGEGDNEEDAGPGQDDEAAELGNLFGQNDL